ncbi:nicotinate-nicotinamide nucleotide adenylyltransferase [Psychrobacter sp. ANT_H3]|uniref:nicotinate-nicotinamide nucleotide adenylyltransferase n=1 Tax=Psychrobacter sp. ANT_H3 TaxID=3019444 RepID=UPI0022F1C0DD|nr:nicotinate-nicotinamide nucleotide adenylyltransferase [Psychrobacter sp. ANT_H3]MDA5133150.1 nicotinate-nicotinamide nucleotide adenylyltransferase [Psychrobacter sp. ANT_H3]
MSNTVKHLPITNTTSAIRAYLGGSFDPVHNGHLQLAIYVYQSLLPLAEQQQRELQVSLLPNARSPFKEDSTNPEHRLAMLKLATQESPLQINELELWQAPPVYTIDSVQTLRARYPNDSLIFIMGMDSARSLDKWKDGLALTDYVNLWVFNREDNPDFNKNLLEVDWQTPLKSQLPVPLQPLTVDSITELLIHNIQPLTDSSVLKNNYQGRIYIDPRPVAAISSTQVRRQLQQQLYQPLPQASQSLNIKHAAETQIASLQPINAIISETAPNSFAKWLNPAVYQYIITHQLYSAAQFR